MLFLLLPLAFFLHAETGADAWLRYAPLQGPALAQARAALPAAVVIFENGGLESTAQAELVRGVRGMLGRTLREETALPRENAILLATVDQLRRAVPTLHPGAPANPEGFAIRTVAVGPRRYLVVASASSRGVLYGTFALLRSLALGESVPGLTVSESPYAPARWTNEWDNLDGSIERGYGGRSIFWEDNRARADLSRVDAYGRLLASIGINACDVNNVNADPRVLAPEFAAQVARIADRLRPWGVRMALSVDFGSPQSIGGLDTYDPLDPRVAAWWQARADDLYRVVPDLAGFVLKADSEGRVGPSTYHRTHADAANVVARALAPHGGLLFYRGFVYDHHMDWRNPKNDRARAAWDNFARLDGKFDDNVVVLIKNGPIDFQVREPASPLFGALKKTNQAIELQVTQEYMGQGRHSVFLAPQWKQTLDFNMHASGDILTPVKALVAGRVFHRPAGGFVGVVNVGLDDNWFGNYLSAANLYAFGRLAWNPDLPSARIEREWSQLTFGANPAVLDTVDSIQLTSWRTYENYTGPLGLQTLTDIVGNHFGVNVEASERNGWGQWHRADREGVGMDRTVATGTGFIGQYRPGVARVFESLATCPDDLLLFFHHVPYTYRLHDGRTVIQYLYDSHYAGAETVADYARRWKALRGKIDPRRFHAILAQLEYQAGQAVVWRDAVTNWFHRESGIADAHGRVGHYPGRVEAEVIELDGYEVREVTPAEDASGGQVVACPAGAAACSASYSFQGAAGWYSLNVEYFDQSKGLSRYTLLVNRQPIDSWEAASPLPPLARPDPRLDSTSSTRHTIGGVALRPGDTIRIEGRPEAGELAALDYIEIHSEAEERKEP
ncbi:MAG: alpha-glucuronidase family glycosyl hydrolase [Bryobacteraceae bacterium]